MDVILINPNHPGIENSIKISPLGISYIAAILEENDIQVKIIDMIAMDMEKNELERGLKTENPQIVGITCLTPFAMEVSDIAKIVKETTNAIVVTGGAHTTALPHEASKDENIDYVVLGEGESIICGGTGIRWRRRMSRVNWSEYSNIFQFQIK